MGYHLAGDIYFSLDKSIQNPESKKQIVNAKAQEAYQMDIERAFGALKIRFAIVRGPTRFWIDNTSISNIMTIWVILHNVIIEDGIDLNLEFFYDILVAVWSPSLELGPINAFHDT